LVKKWGLGLGTQAVFGQAANAITMQEAHLPILNPDTEQLFHVNKNKEALDDNFYLHPREPDTSPVAHLTKSSSANDVFLIVRSFKNDQGAHMVRAIH
jgi:hypothetical protein